MSDKRKKHSILWYVGVGIGILLIIGVIRDIADIGKSSGSSSSKALTASSSGSISNSGSTNTIWKVGRFVDSFGDYTQEKYLITNRQYGSFSNSATTNSSLRWELIATKQYIAFFLYEYGSMQVKGFSSYPDTYKVSVKETDGTVTSFSAKNGNDRVAITNSTDYNKFLSILRKGKEIKISIQETGSAASSSYNLGSIDCSGFSKEFSSL